jgi:alpha-L-fucosidase
MKEMNERKKPMTGAGNKPAAKWAVLLTALLIFGCRTKDERPAEAGASGPESDPAVMAKLEEFRDLKFGLFIHWGPCTQWGARIAWPLSVRAEWARPDELKAWVDRSKNFEVFSRDFFALNQTFYPREFEPEKWAQAAEYAGMKYVVFVTKCHDGFSLFRTAQTDYGITDTSCPFHVDPRADITKEVLEAFREKGFRTGTYFSLPDWHHPDYEDPGQPPFREFAPNYNPKDDPVRWERYLRFMHGQVEELMTGFGPIDILWLDGGGGADYDVPALAALARRHQPGILFVCRGEGGRFENYRTPEQEIPDKPLPYAWETCMTMGDYWAYNPNDYYKSARELIHLLVEIVCKGGNLLLDIGPDAEGRFPTETLARLREVGDWMKFNGEAIYGTRPVAPYREGQVCLTRKDDAVYLIYLAKNAQTKPPREVVVSGIHPAEGAEVTLLGKNIPLEWKKTDTGVSVSIPDKISNRLRGERPYCRHAWTVKISRTAGKPAD